MKSEHRHELQTNDLSKLADKVGSSLEAHYNQILWVVCGILIISAGIVYWTRTSRNAEAAAWTEISSCQTPEQFADVASRHSRTKAATWARLHEAEGYLESGIQYSFTNREKANLELKKALDLYQKLVDQASLPDDARELAMFGLARALESMSDGDEGAALKAYQALLKKYPNTLYESEIKERIEALESSGTQSFYAWFHKLNPKPPEPPKPRDGDPTGANSVPEHVLDVPEILRASKAKKKKAAAKPSESEGPSLGEEPEFEPKATDKPKAETEEPETPEKQEMPKDQPASQEKPAKKSETKATPEEKPAAAKTPDSKTSAPADGKKPDSKSQ